MNKNFKNFLILLETHRNNPIQDFKEFVIAFCKVCYLLPNTEQDKACQLIEDYAREHAFTSIEPLMIYSFYYNKLFDLAYDAFMGLSLAEKKEVKLGDVAWLVNYPIAVSRQEFNLLPKERKIVSHKSYFRTLTIRDTERFNMYLQMLCEKGDPRYLYFGEA